MLIPKNIKTRLQKKKEIMDLKNQPETMNKMAQLSP